MSSQQPAPLPARTLAAEAQPTGLSQADNGVTAIDLTGVVLQAHTINGSVTVTAPGADARLRYARQLPLRPQLVDRTTALAEMDARHHWNSTQPHVLVVLGEPGTGVTTVATEWAHRNSDAFPAQYAVTLGRGVHSALGTLLGAAGTPSDRLPHAIADRAAWWRDHTRHAPAVVLATDPRPRDDVQALLPGADGSVVLIASYQPLTHAREHVRIDPLPDNHMRSLLRQLLGPQRVDRDPDGLDALVTLCRGLPYAARLLAGLADLRHPGVTLTALGTSVAVDAALDSTIGPIMDQTYAALSAPTAALYRGMGACGLSEVTPRIATAISGASPRDTVASLAEFVRAGVARESEPDVFTFGVQARQHARKIAGSEDPPEVRREQILRAAWALVEPLWLANQVAGRDLEPSPPPAGDDIPGRGQVVEVVTPRHALDWADHRRDIVLAIAESAANIGCPEWTEWLGSALGVVPECRGDAELRRRISTVREAGARLSHDPHALRRCLGRIGMDLFEAGDWEPAERALREYQALADDASDQDAERDRRNARKRLALLDLQRGIALRRDTDLTTAESGLTTLIADYHAAGAAGKAAFAMLSRGRARQHLGRLVDAVADTTEAIAIFILEGDCLHLMRAHTQLGHLLTAQGQHTGAIARLREAETSAAELGAKPADRRAINDGMIAAYQGLNEDLDTTPHPLPLQTGDGQR